MRATIYNIEKLEQLKKIFCAYFDIRATFLREQTRKRQKMYNRQLFHYFAYTLKYGTFEDIASYCDNTHATILNSCNRIKGHLSYDKEVINDVEEINKLLKNSEKIISIIEALGQLSKKDLKKTNKFIKELAS